VQHECVALAFKGMFIFYWKQISCFCYIYIYI